MAAVVVPLCRQIRSISAGSISVTKPENVSTPYTFLPVVKHSVRKLRKRLATQHDRLLLVCGHYEGIDERFIEECVDEEISMGDFVLTGGEIPAMALTDAVCRLVPGVLPDAECYMEESHWDGLLEYPQYSRPEEWHGRHVPEILLSGNHQKVAEWRKKESYKRTMRRRPDMIKQFNPNTLDKKGKEGLRCRIGRIRGRKQAKLNSDHSYSRPILRRLFFFLFSIILLFSSKTMHFLHN